uniref:Uncharacterized protein n=1 Tax=Candidozyma auris TaxID=498019 RepID=A0A0L0P6M0_CANAR
MKLFEKRKKKKKRKKIKEEEGKGDEKFSGLILRSRRI